MSPHHHLSLALLLLLMATPLTQISAARDLLAPSPSPDMMGFLVRLPTNAPLPANEPSIFGFEIDLPVLPPASNPQESSEAPGGIMGVVVNLPVVALPPSSEGAFADGPSMENDNQINVVKPAQSSLPSVTGFSIS